MVSAPRFPGVKTSFHAELKSRVEAYFAERKLLATGNWKLYVKTTLIALGFIGIYTWLIFYTPSPVIAIGLCFLLGIIVAAIGFNIMHDGAHGSFSESRLINQVAACSLDFLGASSFLWKMKHNIIHHTYTNIDGFDDDIDVRPMLRMTVTQKKYSFHRFQHLYFVFLYGLLMVFWVGFRDFKKYFNGRIGNHRIKEMGWKDHLTFWGGKVSFLVFFIMIPFWHVGAIRFLIGFPVFSFTTSVVISTVFQLAHVVDELHFPEPDLTNNRMDDEWAIHQVKTTANFCTESRAVTWFTGGLNYQIEHHLFPRVSHIHYPALSKIVKQTTREFGIKYTEYLSVGNAIAAHIKHLRNVGMAA